MHEAITVRDLPTYQQIRAYLTIEELVQDPWTNANHFPREMHQDMMHSRDEAHRSETLPLGERNMTLCRKELQLPPHE